MNEIEINRFNPDDEAVGVLIHECFSAYGTENGIILNYNEFCFVAKNKEGKIIGAINGRTLYDEVHIADLVVDEEYRGIGLGSRLIKTVEENYRGKGFGFITLTTFEFQAPEFYKKLGYNVEFLRENKDLRLTKYFFRKDI